MRSFLSLGHVVFPQSRRVNVNMMPIVLGDTSSIPRDLRQYAEIINTCPISKSEYGKVGYLSIQESFVNQGQSQRRGGIHTEKHPNSPWGGGWGDGCVHQDGLSGIFMASTVNDSLRVWNHHIAQTGQMGDYQHLKDNLSRVDYLPSANELVWMTDSCPHESIPMKSPVFRQWFRLVTSAVDVWYAQHSTKNPLGIKAPCRIVCGNKFDL